MNDIQPDQFGEFFHQLHGNAPFPWQEKLAARVCLEGWPKVIDLPTASGKTACIDIALFALAVSGNDAPRRIFFVVDRRVIVNEAFERAARIGESLRNAKSGVVSQVSLALCALGGLESPLDVYQLRGGAFRDETWVRSPLQPTVVTSTVDQVGSRLLFRGYGIRHETWPIHAGLIGNDALLFLDEAHCSTTFASTLEAVEAYRGKVWAPGFIERPFHFVEMTATPNRSVPEQERLRINDDDRNNPVLSKRLRAVKRVLLGEAVKCRKEETAKFAQALMKQAEDLAEDCAAKRIAILVNRVATAKELHKALTSAGKNAQLVTGRMRPWDREIQGAKLQFLKSGKARHENDSRQYIVCTQCLEVGADFDFDVLVSECASIDSLLQRFGRLDRTGDFGAAMGAVVAASWQLSGREGDPVYGDALKESWNFLNQMAEGGWVNMGLESREDAGLTVLEKFAELDPAERAKMRLTTKPGPKLLPSHLDALGQTSPVPLPSPDIELFLHGPERGNPDVSVVWRRDLNGLFEYHVPDEVLHSVVALCPPTSAEAMPVPIWNFRKWFRGKTEREAFGDESDLEVSGRTSDEEERRDEGKARNVIIWRGKDVVVRRPKTADDIRPGDTLVLPESTACWNMLGHVPDGQPIDLGDIARLQLRRSITLRLHEEVMKDWKVATEIRERLGPLSRLAEIEGEEEKDLRATLKDLTSAPIWILGSNSQSWWNNFIDGCTLSRYPSGPGWILDGFFGRQEKGKAAAIGLIEHLKDVEGLIDRMGGQLIPDDLREALHFAAKFHDYGKADVRFQAWLRNGDRLAAEAAPRLLAKSGQYRLKPQTYSGLPEGFRHELLSLQFAEKADEFADLQLPDLALHEIAAHHGSCRPFAPVLIEEEPECIDFEGIKICRQERLENAAHRLGSGVADRFWALTREYGWWGLAYLEAILRLADWKASSDQKVEGAHEL